MNLDQISTKYIEKFHDWLSEMELSPSSIKRKLACVKAMFRWLEIEEEIVANPFNKVRTIIKLPRRLPRNASATDIGKIIRQTKLKLGRVGGASYSSDYIPSLILHVASCRKIGK